MDSAIDTGQLNRVSLRPYLDHQLFQLPSLPRILPGLMLILVFLYRAYLMATGILIPVIWLEGLCGI